MNEKQKSEQYLEDMREWQDKMYSPGEYLGGKLPPIVKYGNRKIVKPWAWYSFTLLAIGLGYAIWEMVKYFIGGN